MGSRNEAVSPEPVRWPRLQAWPQPGASQTCRAQGAREALSLGKLSACHHPALPDFSAAGVNYTIFHQSNWFIHDVKKF